MHVPHADFSTHNLLHNRRRRSLMNLNIIHKHLFDYYFDSSTTLVYFIKIDNVLREVFKNQVFFYHYEHHSKEMICFSPLMISQLNVFAAVPVKLVR